MLTPDVVTRPWIGKAGDTTGARVLSAGFGARDIAIGAGTAHALLNGESPRPWLLAGAFTDAVDCFATIAGRRSLPPFGVVAIGALAGSGAAVGLWVARELDQPVP